MTARKTWQVVLTGHGVVFLAMGAWAAADAASFTRAIANFGPENAHLVHDFAATSASFGLGLLIAARATEWRTPMLTLAAIWNGLHTVSHIVDIGSAQPELVGPVEAGLLLVVAVFLAGLARHSAKEKS